MMEMILSRMETILSRMGIGSADGRINIILSAISFSNLLQLGIAAIEQKEEIARTVTATENIKSVSNHFYPFQILKYS